MRQASVPRRAAGWAARAPVMSTAWPRGTGERAARLRPLLAKRGDRYGLLLLLLVFSYVISAFTTTKYHECCRRACCSS